MSLKKKNILLVLICSFFFVFINEICTTILNFDEILYKSLIENLSEDQIEKFFKVKNLAEKFNFIFFPIIITIKTILVSTIINIGIIFYSSKNISFNQIINIVLKAEFIFLLVPIFKFIWIYFFMSKYNLEDIQSFFPLSAINITGYNGLESWLIYPLQTLNLFEVAYIIYLSYQIGYLTKTNADNGLKIVGYSYVPALLLWVTIIMFFTLNYS
jgi:hypothetical protein